MTKASYDTNENFWNIVARVDTCLDIIRIKVGSDTRAKRLAKAWVTLRDLWSWDDATEAAMTGILLHIVPEAWGGNCDIAIDLVDDCDPYVPGYRADDPESSAVQVLVSRDGAYLCFPVGPTLIEALVMALEAAIVNRDSHA